MTLRVVIMGVSGCCKSSVGQGLGRLLGLPYRDGHYMPLSLLDSQFAAIAGQLQRP
jgi:gluconate kinase